MDVTQHTEDQVGMAYLAVSLAELPDLTGRYLEFQLADDEDEREEGYCMVDSPPEPVNVTNPLAVAAMVAGHRTLYGGVAECRMTHDHLMLTVNDEAQRIFGWPPVLELQLAVSADDRAALREGLTRVLAIGPYGDQPVLHL
ncbi:hypothetical protein [Micromonospora musae]|uniref:hypothetical protein n=1 Tax=Micromonospora musae TaxID=1894970 RepID=UPI000EA8B648|nr:hypothetical protein [Micromonospora musae]